MERKLFAPLSMCLPESSSGRGSSLTKCSHDQDKCSHDQDTKRMTEQIVAPEINLSQPDEKTIQASSGLSIQPKLIAVASSFPCFYSQPTLDVVLHQTGLRLRDFVFVAKGHRRRSQAERLAARALGPEWKTCVELAMVADMLSALIDEYSKPDFQSELQKLLISLRKIYKYESAGTKVVPGRGELCRSAEEAVLARMDIPITAAASVWKMVARHAHGGRTLSSLCIIDELLALPEYSTWKSLTSC